MAIKLIEETAVGTEMEIVSNIGKRHNVKGEVVAKTVYNISVKWECQKDDSTYSHNHFKRMVDEQKFRIL